MDLTDKILAGMHGRLDITVVRKGGPYVPLHVVGVTKGLSGAWTDLPTEFCQDKMVYLVHSESIQGRQFIFAEDTHIIDAPASAVVDAMLALVAQIDHEVAWRLTEDETAEVDEDDWICEGTP